MDTSTSDCGIKQAASTQDQQQDEIASNLRIAKDEADSATSTMEEGESYLTNTSKETECSGGSLVVPTGAAPEVEQEENDQPMRARRIRDCCDRIREFARQPLFSNVDDQGKQIRFVDAFLPSGIVVIIWKIVALVFSILTWAHGIREAEGAYCMLNFTYWAVVLSVLYLWSSLINSLQATHFSKREQAVEKVQSDPRKPIITNNPRRIHCTWLLSTLAAHSGILSCVIFWPYALTMVEEGYYGNSLASAIPSHGGVMLVVLLDSYLVNQIPVQWIHHLYAVIPYDCLYIVWTIVHKLASIGNPDLSDEDPLTNDDAIYPGMIEWSEKSWSQTLLMCLILFVAVCPLLFWGLKRVSLWLSKVGSVCRSQNSTKQQQKGGNVPKKHRHDRTAHDKNDNREHMILFASTDELDATERSSKTEVMGSSFLGITQMVDDDDDDHNETMISFIPEEEDEDAESLSSTFFGMAQMFSMDKNEDESDEEGEEDDVVYDC